MSTSLTLSLSLCLLAFADLPDVESLRTAGPSDPIFSASEALPFLPDSNAMDMQSAAQSTGRDAQKNTVLQDQSRFALIRYVSGEFAKAVKPLPAGKDGFQVPVGKPLDESALQHSVATHGAAINTGDQVQITKLEFRSHSIVVDVNGGGRGKHSWRDHVQIGFGGPNRIPGSRGTTQTDQAPGGVQPGMG